MAVPGLLDLWDDVGAPREQVIYALARLADTRAQAAFQAGLHDVEEGVRAQAAVGLARIHHPAALAALLQTLDDAPDMLHMDVTPAVQELPKLGLAAAPALLERMANAAPMTRLHAQRAFEDLIAKLGTAVPQGAAYAHDSSAAQRRAAVQRWREALLQDGTPDGTMPRGKTR